MSAPQFDDHIVQRIATFLESIGLAVRAAAIEGPSFLPGMRIESGALAIDAEKLKHPGDLLHEAGHLAILPADQRAALNHDAGNDGGMEKTAIAWSYAAAVHLGIDVKILFHPDGYKGGAQSLADQFTAGYSIGVPLLQVWGMAADAKCAQAKMVPAYPRMLRWVH